MTAAAYAVVCFIWSTTWFAIRVSNRGIPPMLGGGLRLFGAGLLLGLVVAAFKLRPKVEAPSARWALGIAGVLNAVNYAGVYWAEQKIPGGVAAICAAAHPLFAAIIARLWGLERLRPRRVAGLLVGFVGVGVLSYDSFALDRLDAVAVMLLNAAIVWPLYGVLLKRYAGAPHPLRVTAWFLGIAGALMLAVALPDLECDVARVTPRADSLVALGYLVVPGSMVAWALYFFLLRRISISALAAMTYVQPVIAMAVDVVGGDERLTRRAYVGAAFIVAGLVVALTAERGVALARS